MYEVFKAAINDGNYKLEGMLDRIHLYAAKGKITMDEMTELETLARENATVKGEVDVFEKLMELEERIRKLEGEGTSVPAEDYPEYIAGKWYYRDDKCGFNGENFVCIAPDGVVCTWSPAEYPAYWERV